ncbi:hypothetical protein MUG84_26865 [Paenibacillus sp. KQZ6P-2]|uniref:Uncharacterized protein n=1 Tax=Paenibacillus mangrovi TaxID=2931978 RepID=A0A9X1WUL9_9BACL|nr:hypothetical protein [Paenibacillus mangrovi]MCJ8015293.1 hypothetical protein [Paenibacillus mangrovi]
MHKIKSWFFLLIFLASIGLICIGCSFEGKKPSSEENYNQLLTSFHQNGEYVFENLPWLISRQEVLKRKQQNDSSVENTDFLKIEGSFPLTSSSLKKTVVYRFSDDQFVSGEYLFSTHDKNRFIEFCNKLKSHLSESLAEPYANDLSVLEQAGDINAHGKSVAWEGKDRSILKVNLLTDTQQNSEMMYILQIKSSAPLPERKGLAP